jgi:hypothetical protein
VGRLTETRAPQKGIARAAAIGALSRSKVIEVLQTWRTRFQVAQRVTRLHYFEDIGDEFATADASDHAHIHGRPCA